MYVYVKFLSNRQLKIEEALLLDELSQVQLKMIKAQRAIAISLPITSEGNVDVNSELDQVVSSLTFGMQLSPAKYTNPRERRKIRYNDEYEKELEDIVIEDTILDDDDDEDY